LKQVNNATISVDLYRFLLFYPFLWGLARYYLATQKI
jgi:hypothetical protein